MSSDELLGCEERRAKEIAMFSLDCASVGMVLLTEEKPHNLKAAS